MNSFLEGKKKSDMIPLEERKKRKEKKRNSGRQAHLGMSNLPPSSFSRGFA